tara:strand:- start:464 stop:610 length:147 start_codon:yes stop_codon:yes gene_type:complete
MRVIILRLISIVTFTFLTACGGGQDVPDQSMDEPHTDTAEGENPEEEE